jgi:DNA-binding MarR family transcriptional regulator
MYTLRDVPRYENIRAAAARYPELEPASAALFLLLMRVSSDLLLASDKYLAKYGLSEGRFIVLMLLYRVANVPQNPCVLADKTGVTRATMTGLLDNLQRAGYIERQAAAEDRRMLEVKLTAKGKHFLETVMPGYFRLIKGCMAGSSTTEKEQMISLLTKLGATGGFSEVLANDRKARESRGVG